MRYTTLVTEMFLRVAIEQIDDASKFMESGQFAKAVFAFSRAIGLTANCVCDINVPFKYLNKQSFALREILTSVN